jgi:hypothetical protein
MDQTTQSNTDPWPTAAQEPSTLSNTTRQAVEQTNDTTSSPFVRLPREIRDMIYLFAMADLPTRLLLTNAVHFSPSFLYPKTLPALCFTNHQLFEEGTLAYITRTRFVFTDDPESSYTSHYTFVTFLAQFTSGTASVRMLAYQHVQQFGYTAGVTIRSTRDAFERAEGLVGNCTGLRSLILVFPFERAFSCTYTGRKSSHDVLSTGAMREVFMFDALFHLPNLRDLTVRIRRDERFDRFCMAENAVGNLRDNFTEVLVDGFAERGTKPRIVVEVIDEVDD